MGLSSGGGVVPEPMAGGESRAHGGHAEEQKSEGMRVAYILREEEEEQCRSNRKDGGRKTRCGRRRKRHTLPSSSFSSSSPRPPGCLLSRWLPSKQLLKCKPWGVAYNKNDEDLVEEGENDAKVTGPAIGSAAMVDGSTSAGAEEGSVSNSGAAAHTSSEESSKVTCAEAPEKTFLNIGMGAGFLFLLGRSIAEFNKMTELRKEMEVLLKEAKEEIRRKDPSLVSHESKSSANFPGSDCGVDTGERNDPMMKDGNPCFEPVEASCNIKLSNSKNGGASEDERSPRIDKIEEELVSELELLQINMNKQDSSGQFTEEVSGERTDPSESFNVGSGEHQPEEQEAAAAAAAAAEEEEDTRDRHGVCPQELKGRLLELLERRQEERIAELESALELAHTKLREKEMELRSWRDAARLLSQEDDDGRSR